MCCWINGGAGVNNMDHHRPQSVLDSKKQELLERRFLGAKMSAAASHLQMAPPSTTMSSARQQPPQSDNHQMSMLLRHHHHQQQQHHHLHQQSQGTHNSHAIVSAPTQSLHLQHVAEQQQPLPQNTHNHDSLSASSSHSDKDHRESSVTPEKGAAKAGSGGSCGSGGGGEQQRKRKRKGDDSSSGEQQRIAAAKGAVASRVTVNVDGKKINEYFVKQQQQHPVTSPIRQTAPKIPVTTASSSSASSQQQQQQQQQHAYMAELIRPIRTAVPLEYHENPQVLGFYRFGLITRRLS